MSDEKIKTEVVWRFTAAQRPLGRWRMNMYVLWKRLAWNSVVAGAHFLKRMLDIFGSLAAIIFLSPLFLAVSLGIKMDGGPIIYAQKRIGRGGREFKMYKFRSMVVNADQMIKDLMAKNDRGTSITFKMKDDPRLTKIGKWIRILSIDELPQFVNVLIGDMSLVGPRPCLPRELAHYNLEQRRRLDVMPGITGLWQISGRADIGFEGQLKLDARYLESQTFWGDVKILLQTIPAVLLAKGAY